MALPPTKPLERPSSFLVPLTLLLGVPVPVAAQWVPSSFLSSPRLFFFLNLFKAKGSSPFSRSYPETLPGSIAQSSSRTRMDPPALAFQPQAAWPQRSGGGCWTKGGGTGGRVV